MYSWLAGVPGLQLNRNNTSVSFTILLLDAPFSHVAQAMIITPPEDQATTLGENATFTCIASPNIMWAQIVEGITIPIINDVEMLKMGNTVNSTLTISDVKEDDFGNYQCKAGDSFSADVANFTMYEAGK